MNPPRLAASITAYGRPTPKGSMRSVGRGRMIEQNAKHLDPWRAALVAAALAQPVRNLNQPLALMVVVTVAAPARSRFPTPATRSSGDLDKHVRVVCDALTDAAVIIDDSRIVETHAWKLYPGTDLDALDQPGAVIALYTRDDHRPLISHR